MEWRKLHLASVERMLAVLFPALTPRELTICAMVYNDMTSWEIADRLGLSERTVQNHRYRLRRRLALKRGTTLQAAVLQRAMNSKYAMRFQSLFRA